MRSRISLSAELSAAQGFKVRSIGCMRRIPRFESQGDTQKDGRLQHLAEHVVDCEHGLRSHERWAGSGGTNSGQGCHETQNHEVETPRRTVSSIAGGLHLVVREEAGVDIARLPVSMGGICEHASKHGRDLPQENGGKTAEGKTAETKRLVLGRGCEFGSSNSGTDCAHAPLRL
eukprot:2435075-Prymnesium_polylepis.3